MRTREFAMAGGLQRWPDGVLPSIALHLVFGVLLLWNASGERARDGSTMNAEPIELTWTGRARLSSGGGDAVSAGAKPTRAAAAPLSSDFSGLLRSARSSKNGGAQLRAATVSGSPRGADEAALARAALAGEREGAGRPRALLDRILLDYASPDRSASAPAAAREEDLSGLSRADREALSRYLAERQPVFRACYEDALLVAPDLAGRVSLALALSASAEVSGVDAAYDGKGAAAGVERLRGCLDREGRRLKLPASLRAKLSGKRVRFSLLMRT